MGLPQTPIRRPQTPLLLAPAQQAAATAPDIDAYMRSATVPAPGAEQAQVIAMIQAMMASKDPVQRLQAQAFMHQFGRSFLGTATNTATGGFTDYMMTKGPGDYRRGIPRNFEYYDPGELAFATQLSRAVDPGGVHGAEMAGTAAKIAAGCLPGWASTQLAAYGHDAAPGTSLDL